MVDCQESIGTRVSNSRGNGPAPYLTPTIMGLLIISYARLLVLLLVAAVAVAGFAVRFTPEAQSRESGNVFCVSSDATEEGSGHCWDDPMDLHTALRAAEPGDEIWIQQGRYFPGESPHATFHMPDGVDIYGGFTGSIDDPSDRDVDPVRTVLDGQDLSYSVVTAAGISQGMLNGVTIVNGAATVIAEDAIDPHRRGGGIYISNSTVTFQNLVIANNRARFGGGGVYVDEGSNPTFRNVTLQGNVTTHSHSGRGGGMRILSGDSHLIDVTFRYNEAIRGAGLFVDDGDITIERGLFSENRASDQGGGLVLHRGDLTITDSRFVFNESGTEGGAIVLANGAGDVSIADVDVIGNLATSGGGIEIGGGTVTISNSEISSNEAPESGGGGISATDATIDVRNSFVQGNYAVRGGGIWLSDASATMINVVLSGNLASAERDSNSDAGAAAEGMPYEPLRRSITGEMITGVLSEEEDQQPGEVGGAILVQGKRDVEIINATIAGNRSDLPGAAIYRTGDNTLHLLNSIVYGNLATEVEHDETLLGLVEIRSTAEQEYTTRLLIGHSIVRGGCWPQPTIKCWNVLDEDPLFREPTDARSAPTREGDLELWFTSSAIDTANPEYLPVDIDQDALGGLRAVTKRTESPMPWSNSSLDIGAIEAPLRHSSPERAIDLDHTSGGERCSLRSVPISMVWSLARSTFRPRTGLSTK
jgi:hypothetical protein